MKKRNVELWIGKGTEVHGPDGWVALLGDCVVTANIDASGHEWHYKVKDDDWWVPRLDALVRG